MTDRFKERSDNPLRSDVERGYGGHAGGKFIQNDGTTVPVVHGWLTQLDGNLLLPLGGDVIEGARIFTLP